MRARHGDGMWARFSEFEWGGPYVEGGAWQSSWAVQHDPKGLIDLVGGAETLAGRLIQLLNTPPKFEVGHYGFEIHEMTEMAQAQFGQYAHSNQPVHHLLYLLIESGRPDVAHPTLHRVMRELYTPNHFPGDEDNGEMSCWYLWSALGIYPACPGKPEYIHGAPALEYAKILTETGAEILIESEGWTPRNSVVQDRSVNGVQTSELYLDHSLLSQGAKIQSKYS